MSGLEPYGFVGNIWVMTNHMEKAGDSGGGHAHAHDHVSLIVKGSVRVTVGNHEPKDFYAPTFVVVKKGLQHQFTALEDDTVWYCVFALRDIDGVQTDIVDSGNLPNSVATYNDGSYENYLKWLETQPHSGNRVTLTK